MTIIEFADKKDVKELIHYVDDSVADNLFTLACTNSDAIIRNKLSEYITVIDNLTRVPADLKVAANYYAVAEILQSIQQGKNAQDSTDYVLKADSIIKSYITSVKPKPYTINQSLTARQIMKK